jgi:signal transduction histidine kinase
MTVATLPTTRRLKFNLTHAMLAQAWVGLYLLAALFVFAVSPFVTANWLALPFLGGFIEPTLVFNDAKPFNPPDSGRVNPPDSGRVNPASPWSALNQGIQLGDQPLSIDGVPVSSTAQIEQVLKQHTFGQQVSLAYRTPQGQQKTIQVTLTEFPAADRPGYIYIPYLIGLVFLVCSLWIFGIRRSQASGQAFAVFTASVAIATATLFDLYTTHRFALLWSAALPLAAAALIQLALTFPRPTRLVLRFPWLALSGYLPAVFIWVNTAIRLQDQANRLAYITAWQVAYVFAGLAVLFYFGWNTAHRFTTESPIEREQARLILVGLVCAFLPLALWFLITVVKPEIGYSPFLMLPMTVFPVVTGYAIQRYRLLHTDYILSRLILYGVMTMLAAGGYSLLVSGLSLLLADRVAPDNPLLIGVIIFLMALAFTPLRERVQHMVDAIFYRGEKALQEKVQSFSHELTRSVDLASSYKLIRDYTEQALIPSQLHIYVYDPITDQYTSAPGADGQPTSDIRFPADSTLVSILHLRRAPVFISSGESIPSSLEKERQRLMVLAAQLYIPMPGRQRLVGWLALGPRRSREPYSSADLRFLESLGDQSAMAIERSQVVTNMERRVLEMNILSRLALGINVTVNFNDILELIYAQTNLVIPARDFYLALYDPETEFFQYAFYLEDNERVSTREAKPVPPNQTLEQEIIRSRRPILTTEYSMECRRLGLLPVNPRLYAWMGVPLNSGAETIGVISLGSRDPAVVFSSDQLNLLQSIADQTAGGIVKARLLQETQQRAHQLAALNDVTRQLTSTLETEPLLKNILQSAVDILNCEAGSLLLVDEQTDELVFRVTVGPVAADLVGQRMAPGAGIVGKSFKSRQPVTVNNVQQSSDWYSGTDQHTSFQTRTVLATPLEVKNTVIGVIEVINRLDGQPFTYDDQSLLAAFASQAAVAFENARLYTLTDQALAARVDELSVMQRIDRELNTSLDISNAMRITLEWAMRQSKTTAGLVGVIEEHGIQIMASQGYTDELLPFEDAPLPLEFLPFQTAIKTGQPQQVEVINDQDIRTSLLTGARQQVIIPIRREASAIGVLLLESTQAEPLSEETFSFLNRLSDHAAIAISNAQLYAAVQSANLAKSEFVSFVSHELKNPMTSIKGYTELLAAGAVGPVNEGQANFLSTIRSNVERMSTLVSDLADVSRIEAGRLRLDFKPLPVTEISEEVIRSLRRQVEEKQQKLKLEFPSSLPMVWADRTRLNQVLTNLINNACKYTPTGGQITVGAEKSSNTWDPSGPPEVVHLWVKDTGIGISAEDQAHIFQKFFRSEDPKTRESPGTGLGLNITKSLVEMQGGQIWFESVFRQGSTFHFTIPVAD